MKPSNLRVLELVVAKPDMASSKFLACWDLNEASNLPQPAKAALSNMFGNVAGLDEISSYQF